MALMQKFQRYVQNFYTCMNVEYKEKENPHTRHNSKNKHIYMYRWFKDA